MRTYIMYPTTAVRQGCARSVVLSSCFVPVICVREQNLRHKTLPLWYVRQTTVFRRKCKDGLVYEQISKKVPILPTKLARSMEMRSKRPHTRNMGYGGVTNATLRSKNQLLQQQPHAYRVEGCCCWGAGLLLGSRIVACCPVQKEGNVRVLSSRKPGLHPILTCLHGDRGCGTPISAGMLRKPKAERVSKACHARHTARIAPKPPAT